MPALYKLFANPPPLGSTELLTRETQQPFSYLEAEAVLKPPSGLVEHVNCLVDGRIMHLFCDENGHALGLPANLRASVIYANHHLVKPFTLSQLLLPIGEFKIWHTDAEIMIHRNLIIAGDCLLWTGDWS